MRAKSVFPFLCGLCFALAGCESWNTTPLTNGGRYSFSISTNAVAKIESTNGSIELFLIRDGKTTAWFWSDGETIDVVEPLNLGARAEDSPHASSVWVATKNGKLLRHGFQWFDGKSWQMIFDTNCDFFPDYRISVEVDKNDKTIQGSRRKEIIEYKFKPSSTNAKPDLR